MDLRFAVVLVCAFTSALLCGVASADTGPADVVNAHFKAISEEDYDGANTYFTEAFMRSFNSTTGGLRDYYTARRQQVKPGWKIVETAALSDEGKETAVVVVDFGDPRKESPVVITERMYYYLMRVPVKGKAFGAAADGKAWRIDIFDALRFATLAEARRRPYLYTKDAWPEDQGRELRSRQGLFRIQWALTQYFTEHGEYPQALQGGTDKNEPLIAGGFLRDAYPDNGFTGSPIKVAAFDVQSPGDFAYYPVNADGDDKVEGYWLLLHGAVSERNFFTGFDAIYIASGDASQDQTLLANAFAAWWQKRGGAQLQVTGATAARVASFSLIRPRIEEVPASWWASLHGHSAATWVGEGARRVAEEGATAGGLNVMTFGF
jgi:hypothetical protein